MKMKLSIVILAVVAALSATPAWGAMAKVKGVVLDDQGKPIVGAVVELKNLEAGTVYTLKADGKGEFISIAINPGTYDVRVLKDGQQIFQINKFPVTLQRDNELDIDLKAERARAEQELTPEQKAQIEAAQKENAKIKNLNGMIVAATNAIAAKNYEEAVRVMTEATQIDATKFQLWNKLAESNMAYGRSLFPNPADREKAKEQFQLAINAYKKAVELRPTEGAFYNNMAEAYSRLGQPQEAVAQYQLAIEKNPTDPKYYFNMGAVLTNMGKVDEANAAFDKVIAADPTYADAYYQKAVNSLAKAKIDPKTGVMVAPPEVAEGFNKYLELSPTGKNAQDAKDLLASIGAKVETSYGKKSGGQKK